MPFTLISPRTPLVTLRPANVSSSVCRAVTAEKSMSALAPKADQGSTMGRLQLLVSCPLHDTCHAVDYDFA